MAIRYTRPYDEILDELSGALATIPDCYETFEMSAQEWDELKPAERDVCIRTLADDLFYVLGSSSAAEAGSGKVEYDKAHHVIKVISTPQLVHLVGLREQA
ncbi:hypothetical protein [Cohnella nanjingensis]|uniref:Uncharacterized protein n=1 Tax=Cohnella nanjingensis TaxID=1387779 RepID=A0A7X0RWK3_9BACL|nr:hypothetical protein [Cohnella nanjingensis]MBB6675003.1 hypothetical protein [Cohnella nanjingensis]